MQGREFFYVLLKSVFKDEMNTHIFDTFASGGYTGGFVFPCDMAVEAYRKAHARFFNNLLLLFVLEKFGDLVVRSETVQTV